MADRTERNRAPLKARLFRSNMTILFAALLALMVVILSVLVVFEDALEKQLHAITQTTIESHASAVVDAVSAGEEYNLATLAQTVGPWGYEVSLIADGRVLEGSTAGAMEDLAQLLADIDDESGRASLMAYEKATVVSRYLAAEDAYLVAVHFDEENWLTASLNRSFYHFLGVLALCGVGAIALLLLLASFFTRRLNRIVLEPVEQLEAAAERIKAGNLEEPIFYEGAAEFERVCESFNDMQQTILRDQAQRAQTEQARIDMVTGISHDLRTPLTAIQGYIKGVLDGVANTEEKRQRYLSTAISAAQEMNTLLQKLFDFSRMESGQMPFYFVPVDLGEFTAAYCAQHAARPGNLGYATEGDTEPEALVLACTAEPGMPEVSVDVTQLTRIFDNLLENSLKYARRTPVVCRVRVEAQAASVAVIWQDNGDGVPAEKLTRIFDRFYRCDEARTEKGSGVGLYVVRAIMERHQGQVWAENDGGLKITLVFPRMQNETKEVQ